MVGARSQMMLRQTVQSVRGDAVGVEKVPPTEACDLPGDGSTTPTATFAAGPLPAYLDFNTHKGGHDREHTNTGGMRWECARHTKSLGNAAHGQIRFADNRGHWRHFGRKANDGEAERALIWCESP